MRGGDRVTVLTPHAEGLPAGWTAGGVEVVTFRYAPVRQERLGYGRTLEADERFDLAARQLRSLAAGRVTNGNELYAALKNHLPLPPRPAGFDRVLTLLDRLRFANFRSENSPIRSPTCRQ